ncbi:MAG: sugar transferase [Verrucomicrobiales bacterium]|nr:sugar transferase [Verrucomicrobiales bacterium]
MSEEEIRERVLRRYSVAQNPVGLWRLNLYVRWKRCSWRCFVAGTALLKRAFDMVASFILLIVLLPLLAVVALLVKLEDGGPVFFAQTRVGRWGCEFKMLKFRSMSPGAEEQLPSLLARNEHREGVAFKIKNDPRITKAGRWMRRYSLDELPQLWNVLRGEMSLVGPRPPWPREVAHYTPADRRRLTITPGITCLWQVGGRSEIDFSGQVKLDVLYIESQSFWGDVRILLRTVPAVLSGRGAS